ncbi:glycosyl hydrolase family 28-related protein [Rhodosalinus sp.]|uniref:glycosyl hydrolase family 28-related protein n=1 Tax=Rhodosalinus sp. TaxID=2047741 RepID=UPI00356770E4
MNKAITEGAALMPPPFADGLDQWAKGDGTPGSDTYAGDPDAAVVPADPDFGGCLELLKSDEVQRLRYMGETPMLEGCYLRVTARVKAVSGNLPAVRIAAWPGDADGGEVEGLTVTGPAVAIGQYGEVVEVTAIVGPGRRTGVDMVWGTAPAYGHFGLDLTGPSGGVVRIDDLSIEDATHVFHREMMSRVDVRDFGAVGDGSTDDSAAFEAADSAANGRRVLVPAGTYRLARNVTLDSPVIFEGRLSMPDDAILSLTRDFRLPVYIDAFGNEEQGFRKAFQALLNNADHESLDMGGRRVSISGPIDMAAAVPNRDRFSQRRVIRNGQLYAEGETVWEPEVVTSQATYSPSQPRRLSNVANIANVPVGALVEGAGVGREIYVRSRNVAAGDLTLSEPLHDADGTQVFTFTRFKYMLDFSGFERLDRFALADLEIQCNTVASGVMLAPVGVGFQMRECFVTRPRDRGLTSIGEGCQGMLVDRCQFITREGDTLAQDRTTVALNANANDVKLRDNRCTQFRHFAVLGGQNAVIAGNHFFQGDSAADGVRLAGIALLTTNASATITGNYVDNCFVEWTNERDPDPSFTGGFSFAGLSVTDNTFLCSGVAPWFSFLVVKPHGPDHGITGLAVTGNVFRCSGGAIDRVERVDTAFADLDYARTRDVTFAANTFHNIGAQSANPLRLEHTQNTEAASWTVEGAPLLPFGGRARQIDALVPTDRIRNGAGASVPELPHVDVEQGAARDQLRLNWSEPVRGRVSLTIRMDS